MNVHANFDCHINMLLHIRKFCKWLTWYQNIVSNYRICQNGGNKPELKGKISVNWLISLRTCIYYWFTSVNQVQVKKLIYQKTLFYFFLVFFQFTVKEYCLDATEYNCSLLDCNKFPYEASKFCPRKCEICRM